MALQVSEVGGIADTVMIDPLSPQTAGVPPSVEGELLSHSVVLGVKATVLGLHPGKEPADQ